MSDMTTPIVWPLELWQAAGPATDHRLAKLCPFCPDPSGLQVTVQGVGSFNVPLDWNATGFTIVVPAEGDESTVTWSPCAHTIRVEGRLNERPAA